MRCLGNAPAMNPHYPPINAVFTIAVHLIPASRPRRKRSTASASVPIRPSPFGSRRARAAAGKPRLTALHYTHETYKSCA